ncbi:MAG: GNAT family N-acetyltransferase [Mycobacteriales bacterium]
MTSRHGLGSVGMVRVRAGTAADVPVAAEVWRAAWYDGHRGHVPDALLAARDPGYFHATAAALAGGTLLAVDPDDRIVGLVIVKDDELVQLAVDRTARRGGVGALLLAAAEARIAATGHDRAWLAVVPGNTTARAFYERHGWTDDGPLTYAAPAATGGPVPVPVRRYLKALTS